MSKTALKQAQHPEMKQIAQKIIDEQSKEIAQMTEWKKEWKSH